MEWRRNGKMEAVTWQEQIIDHEHAGPRCAVNQQISWASLINDTKSGNKCFRGWHLHSVSEFLRPLSLLGEHRMRRLSDGDAAEGFTDGVAQLFGRRLLWGGREKAEASVTSCRNSRKQFRELTSDADLHNWVNCLFTVSKVWISSQLVLIQWVLASAASQKYNARSPSFCVHVIWRVCCVKGSKYRAATATTYAFDCHNFGSNLG